MPLNNQQQYWRANLKLMSILLLIWFMVSFVGGILMADYLNQFKIGGFMLGFWMAQQGSMYVFLLLIGLYIIGMNRIDKKFGMDDQ